MNALDLDKLRTLLGREDTIDRLYLSATAAERAALDMAPSPAQERRRSRRPDLRAVVDATVAQVLEMASALPDLPADPDFQRGWRAGAQWRNDVHAEQASRPGPHAALHADLIQQAIADPGRYTPRTTSPACTWEQCTCEPKPSWQARAVIIALAGGEPR